MVEHSKVLANAKVGQDLELPLPTNKLSAEKKKALEKAKKLAERRVAKSWN